MAAFVVLVTPADWPVVESYLRKLGEGGILIPPDVQRQFRDRYGDWQWQRLLELNGQLVDYTFDPCDVMVEVARVMDAYPMEAVLGHLGIGEGDER